MVDEIEALRTTIKHAEGRLAEIQRSVLASGQSLTQLLIRAYRQGHTSEKAKQGFEALRHLVDEAQSIYEAAIAQPEPKIRTQRISLS